MSVVNTEGVLVNIRKVFYYFFSSAKGFNCIIPQLELQVFLSILSSVSKDIINSSSFVSKVVYIVN